MTEIQGQNQYCYKHPGRQTYLRCNECGRPICDQCAVKVPTGYRCKECVNEHRKSFDTAKPQDYLIGAVIAFITGFGGSFISQLIPFLPVWITALVFGLLCGRLVCTLVRLAVRKRRAGRLTLTVAIAAGIGALLPRVQNILLNIKYTAAHPGFSIRGLTNILADLLFLIIIVTVIRTEMSGMVFRN